MKPLIAFRGEFDFDYAGWGLIPVRGLPIRAPDGFAGRYFKIPGIGWPAERTMRHVDISRTDLPFSERLYLVKDSIPIDGCLRDTDAAAKLMRDFTRMFDYMDDTRSQSEL